MKLHIKKNDLLSDIQNEFNTGFPYLKIEFFKHSNTARQLSSEKEKIDPRISLKNLIKWEEDKVIEVDEKMTIHEFAAMLERQYGLFVRVSRKSGRVWITTSFTDDWTIARQNEEGKLMSTIHEVPSEKQMGWNDRNDL